MAPRVLISDKLSDAAGMPIAVGTRDDVRPGSGVVSRDGDAVTVVVMSTGKLARTVVYDGRAVSFESSAPDEHQRVPKAGTPGASALPEDLARQARFEREMGDGPTPPKRGSDVKPPRLEPAGD